MKILVALVHGFGFLNALKDPEIQNLLGIHVLKNFQLFAVKRQTLAKIHDTRRNTKI